MTQFLHDWGAVVGVAACALGYIVYMVIEIRIDNRLLKHLDKMDKRYGG